MLGVVDRSLLVSSSRANCIGGGVVEPLRGCRIRRWQSQFVKHPSDTTPIFSVELMGVLITTASGETMSVTATR